MPAHFDVLVIGAGTAGCVVAARLSEDPHRSVGLLEAGQAPSDPAIADPLAWPMLGGRPYDWAYRTVPQAGTAGRVHDWPRGRLLGGSSALNAMAHVRGHPADFDAWAEAAGPGWAFDSLLPAFRRSEDFSGGASPMRGQGGPLPVLLPDAEVHPLARDFMAAGRALGAPALGEHNAGPLAGVAPNQLTIRAGRRVTAADAYLAPAASRPNLTVLTGCEVDRLDLSGRRVEAVQVSDGRRLSADVVVLCAGALASPLLLMRSGVGRPGDLEAAGVACRVASPEVGRNLQDHLLAAGLVYEARQPVAPSRLQHSVSLMYLFAADPSRAEGAPDSVIACVVLPVVTERFARPERGTAFTLLAGFTHPTSRGSLRLSGPGRSDPPVVDPHYLATAHDRAAFRESLRLARRVGEGEALAAWRGREILPGPSRRDDADLDAFLAEAAMTHHHPCGTCRMGRDRDAVVGEDLAVAGLDNL